LEVDEDGVVWRYNKLADHDDARILYSKREETRLPRIKKVEFEENDKNDEKKKKKSNKILNV
jgi:hypothetical protein